MDEARYSELCDGDEESPDLKRIKEEEIVGGENHREMRHDNYSRLLKIESDCRVIDNQRLDNVSASRIEDLNLSDDPVNVVVKSEVVGRPGLLLDKIDLDGVDDEEEVEEEEGAEQAFPCLFCDRSFSIEKALMAHERSHVETVRNTPKRRAKRIASEKISEAEGDDYEDDGDVNYGDDDDYEEIGGINAEGHNEEEKLRRIVGKEKSKGRKSTARSSNGRRERTLACRFCEYRCAKTQHLVVHERTHTGVKPYSCQLCSYTTSRKDVLNIHVRTHLKTKYLKCSNCEYACNSSKSLERHGKTCTPESPLQLHDDNQKEGGIDAVERDKEKWKRMVGKEKSKKGEKRANLSSKIITNGRGKKKFACKFCDYRCTKRPYLIVHERTHTGVKPYSCQLCSYTASRKDVLNNHVRIHSKTKHHKCPNCEYACNSRKSLVQHAKTCTSESPLGPPVPQSRSKREYICSLCEKRCLNKQILEAHERTHTGEKPFSCNFCEFSTAWYSALSMHGKLKHPDDLKEFEQWEKENAKMEDDAQVEGTDD